MTGINQTTMIALAMVVIASMIGARGLGEQVLISIGRLMWTRFRSRVEYCCACDCYRPFTTRYWDRDA